MKDKEGIIRDLIQDEYFQRLIINPDKECIEFWRQWESEDSERKYLIGEAKKIILSVGFNNHDLPGDKKDLIWENISTRIDTGHIEFSRKRRDLIRNIGYGIAASVAIILAVIFFNTSSFHNSKSDLTDQSELIEKIAPAGKISTFEFEDGTIVKLFSGTKITYPKKFDVHKREVYVDGEAFFNVSKNKDRPFIVKTNSLVTTAIGTSFNVRTYENNNNCDVSLVTGKVKVEKLNKSIETLNEIILEPGEEAHLKNGGVVKQSFNIEERVSWKDGYIYLHDKSFEESVEILKRWFHVDFEVENQYKSKGKKGTGKFKNQNLKNILDVMGHSFGFTFEISGDKVFVKFK